MPDIELDIIKSFPLFSDLEENALVEIAGYIRISRYNRDEDICRTGDINELFYIIKSGHLRVLVVDSDGEVRFQSTLSAGACFGEMSILTGDSVSADISAIIDSELYTINKKDFLKIINSYPSVSVKLSGILSNRLKRTSLGTDLDHKETELSAVLGPADKISATINYSYLIAESLSKVFNRKVLLLIFEPDFPPGRIETIKRMLPDKSNGHGIFNMYNVSKDLDIGMLEGKERGRCQENAAQLISDFVPRYQHVIAVSSINNELDDCNFFSHVKRTIILCPLKSILRNQRLDFLDLLKGSEKAMTVFASGEHKALKGRHRARRIFKGRLFTYSSNTPGNHSSGTIVRAARFFEGKSFGIVFGGGGSRGFAHIGVMKVLEKNGLEPDVYCGSSMGAIVASLFAMGYSAGETEEILRRRLTAKGAVFDFQIPVRSFLRGRKIKRIIKDAYSGTTFDDLIYDLYVVCTDLISGKEVIFDKGLLRTSIYATGALPGILRPLRMDGKYLVDGGILNRVPISVLKDKGVQNTIVVNVTPQKDLTFSQDYVYKNSGWFRKILLRNRKLRELLTEPNIMRIISRSFNLVNLKHSTLDLGPGDFLIRPRVEKYDFYSLKDFDKIVAKGEEAGEEAIINIQNTLNLIR